MNVAYVNPFVSAVVHLFKTMMKENVTPGAPKLKSSPSMSYDVSGIIGLSGEAQGTIAISFPKIMALKVVSKMLGTDIKIIGPEVSDAIGEIVNIVAGNAKQELTQFKLSISLPNIVMGKDHVLAGQSGVPTIIVPFTCSLGEFAMEISLKSK